MAFIPRQQIMVQLYAAMTTMGLCPEDLLAMKKPEHMFEFLKGTLSAAIMDGKQTPYYSDYVLQSVTPVDQEAVALSNLQPIPGIIEYAPGCNACFYRKHTDSQWYRSVHLFIILSHLLLSFDGNTMTIVSHLSSFLSTVSRKFLSLPKNVFTSLHSPLPSVWLYMHMAVV